MLFKKQFNIHNTMIDMRLGQFFSFYTNTSLFCRIVITIAIDVDILDLNYVWMYWSNLSACQITVSTQDPIFKGNCAQKIMQAGIECGLISVHLQKLEKKRVREEYKLSEWEREKGNMGHVFFSNGCVTLTWMAV